VTEKSEAIACARVCGSSWLRGWWIRKELEKWRAKEENRHKGSLIPPKIRNKDIFAEKIERKNSRF
jgi:hypothetical protein